VRATVGIHRCWDCTMRRPNAIFRALANQVCANAFMDTSMYNPISIWDAIR